MNVPGFKSISFTLLVSNSLFFLLGIFLSFQGLLLSALLAILGPVWANDAFVRSCLCAGIIFDGFEF